MINDRQIRGYAIISKGDMPEMVSEETFLVPSQSSEKKYTVNFTKSFKCDCPDFNLRHNKCKHIYAVEFLLKMRGKNEEIEFEKVIEQPKCPTCQSMNIKKNGQRKNENGNKQRFYCVDCKKSFIKDNDFAKIKADPKVVTLCMDLYYKGLSFRDIKDTLNQFFGIGLHHETVRRWIMRYTQTINDHVKDLKPKVSGAWHADEQMIKVKGEWLWNWNIMDERTRFLIASNITRTRHIKDAQEVMKKAKETTDGKPEFMITDGLFAYEKAIRREMWNYPRTKHMRLPSIRDKRTNNNVIERFHSTFRERDKVMRGFKSEKTAKVLSEGFNTYYNFVRPHQSLNNLTPSQTAGIDLHLQRNKWLGLVKGSLQN